MPQLEPIDFENVTEEFPEKWEESVRHPVDEITDDTYTVNDMDTGSDHTVRLVKRGKNWYSWCDCRDFDGLEFCTHVFSVARTRDDVEAGSNVMEEDIEETIQETVDEEEIEETVEDLGLDINESS